MLNFDKIGVGNVVNTVLPPREIFQALPKKDNFKFQYPRDVQSEVCVNTPTLVPCIF
jgi:hypothetical protein